MCGDIASRSRRAIRASFAWKIPPSDIRGRRECRAPNAPAASCAKCKKHTSVVTTVTPEITRHSPRNGFNGFLRALPGDRLVDTVAGGVASANLTPAPGCQDHTTSPSATRLRQRLRRALKPVRRSFSEGGNSALVFGAARVHRIPSRVRDDREPPL
jgi:hypothetical protein